MHVLFDRYEWNVADLDYSPYIYRRDADNLTCTSVRSMTRAGVARIGVPALA
jgi:hypothetical protein